MPVSFLTAEQERLYPDAPDALAIACRGQHIERWLLPRKDFPEGREGYLTWRREQGRRHAERVMGLMRDAGYPDDQVDHAGRMLRKEGIKRDPAVQAALLAAMAQVAGQAELSSAHVTFCTHAERDLGEAQGWLGRTTTQYHWENRGYGSFEDFLGDLSSRKRKAIRKERERANAFGGTIRSLTGDELRPGHWDAFWRFYQDTGSRKWGRPYLTRDFFDRLHESMRDDVLLVLAEREGRPVAGALNLIGRDTLFGRYWGCVEDHPYLHFELCYHRAIDWAIAHGLSRVEAGAQGEHKLARGYLPSQIHSLHWVADAGFRRAVADFVAREAEAVDEEVEVLTAMGPFRREAREEQD